MMRLEPSIHDQDAIYTRVISALKNNTPIVYSKINHGFWEQIVAIEQAGFSYTETDPLKATKADRSARRWSPFFVETGFVSDVLAMFNAIPKDDPNYIFSAGLQAWPHSNIVQGIPLEPTDIWQNKIDKYVPQGALTPHADGIEFKRAVINGQFKKFTDIIAQESFIFVGNKNLKYFPEFIGAEKCTFFEISPQIARQDRHAILESLQTMLGQPNQCQRVLFQAGGSLTAWLICKLYQNYRETSFIDLGVACNICNPARILNSKFGRAYKHQILQTMQNIHPGWIESHTQSLSGGSTPDKDKLYELRSGRVSSFRKLYKKAKINTRFDVFDQNVPLQKPVSFIENKPIQYGRINQFLALSRRQNHYANAGPVSRLLEACLERLLKLPAHRKVIMCSSCTAGLHIAAGIHAINADQSLKWVGSSFGFMSSNIGPLSDLDLIDCNSTGHLEPASLSSRPDSSYDGVLYTHSFSLNLSAWQDVSEYCEKHGKKLIIDNALGLLDRPENQSQSGHIEVVSCRHTKAWGYGEGGFMIVDANDEKLARSLVNCGVGIDSKFFQYAGNSKISDLACAAILDRMERLPHWSFYYQNQAHRLRRLIQESIPQLKELPFAQERKSPVTNLQFLAPHPVSLAALNNEHFVMRKYYRPLKSNPEKGSCEPHSNANTLFAHMINIPCHPFMRNVASHDILSVLNNILANN